VFIIQDGTTQENPTSSLFEEAQEISFEAEA
jgi:hypothetical protein